MKKFFYLLTLLLSFQTMQAQEKGFIIHGQVNLPDGYSVGIVCQTDTNFSVSIADSHIKDGQFVLKGKHLESPAKGTLMTNNLELVEKNHWPTDSIRWTYNDIFLSDGNLTFTPDYRLIGTQVQRDYNLTDEQVAHLEKTIQPQGVDAVREKEYAKRIRAAKFTTKGSGVADLDLLDVNGKRCQLTGVVPRGKYVLIDFWASWCGMCLHAMPEVAEIAKDFKDIFCVIGVSIDTKDAAWRKAMEKHPEPWPQYITTKQGYQDLFDKYQVGNGVPYYLLVAPDGKVITSPEHLSDVREYLNGIATNKK